MQDIWDYEDVAQATSVECKGWFCLHLGQRYPVGPLCKCLHKFTDMDASFIPQACFNPISLAFDISYQCPFLLNLTHKHISLNLSPSFKKYTYLLLEWKAWQHAGVIFHLLPHRIWGANLGHQAWQQIPLSAVPSWLSEKHNSLNPVPASWTEEEGKGGDQKNINVVLSLCFQICPNVTQLLPPHLGAAPVNMPSSS